MNLKTVSTILCILSALLLGNGLHNVVTVISDANFEPQRWHLEFLGNIAVYFFSAYFFWNFRKRIK
ncbi:MAG: hypothetical protein ACI959_001622 [Limisphaerales bacterium]|jgi:hypothetical protein